MIVMLNQPILQTSRLLLRPFVLSDGLRVQKLAGAKEVAATTANIPHPYPDGAAENWIKTHQLDREKGAAITYAVCLRETNELIGAVALMIKAEHHHAELGYWIGVPFWSKGYCSEASRAVLDYGFQEIKLERIFAHYFVSNPASGRVMQKLGMKYEGCYRKHIYKWGEYHDVAVYGMLRSEWQSNHSNSETLDLL